MNTENQLNKVSCTCFVRFLQLPCIPLYLLRTISLVATFVVNAAVVANQ